MVGPFIDWYLLPMAAAIWSAPTARILEFSLSSFVAFCNNHGLLQIFDRPRWYTVKGGGREYVQRLAAGIDQIRLGQPVDSLRRRDGVTHRVEQWCLSGSIRPGGAGLPQRSIGAAAGAGFSAAGAVAATHSLSAQSGGAAQ
jgi:hypothetical protein